MPKAICFKCNNSYSSNDPNDFMFEEANGREVTIPTGDGKCPKCAVIIAKIALEIDIKMANRRCESQEPTRLQLFQDALKRGGAVNVKDLGLNSLNK